MDKLEQKEMSSMVLHSASSTGINSAACNEIENINKHYFIPEKMVCEPQIIETVIERPKIIYQKKIVEVPEIVFKERVVEVEQMIEMEKIIHVPRIHYVEKIIEVPKVQIQEIEVPRTEIEYVNKYVKVPQVVIQEKICPVPKIQIEERLVHVPKYEYVEKIVEKIRHEYKEVERKNIIEVPQVKTEYVYVDVPVPQKQVREYKVDKIIEVPEEKIVERIVKVPIQKIKEIPKYVKVPVPQKVFVTHEKIIPRPVIKEQPIDTYEEIEVPRYVVKKIERPYPVVRKKIIDEEFIVEVPVEKIVEKVVLVPREIKKVKRVPYSVESEPVIQTTHGVMKFSEFSQKYNNAEAHLPNGSSYGSSPTHRYTGDEPLKFTQPVLKEPPNMSHELNMSATQKMLPYHHHKFPVQLPGNHGVMEDSMRSFTNPYQLAKEDNRPLETKMIDPPPPYFGSVQSPYNEDANSSYSNSPNSRQHMLGAKPMIPSELASSPAPKSPVLRPKQNYL